MATLNQAEKVLNKLGFISLVGGNLFINKKDNNELHDLLNDECTSFKTLCDQDVWVFGDSSFITRLEEDYFFGVDVGDFEIIHEEQLNNQ